MEERKTRRNKRIMVVTAIIALLAAILCIGGVTYAKYVSSQQVATKTATVAKWGYVITADAKDLFGKGYTEDTDVTDDTVLKVASDGDTLSVSAYTGATDGVVAPGATGSMTISIKGSAEVAAKLSVKVDEFQDVVLTKTADSSKYAPIKWTLEKVGTPNNTVIGTANDTLANCIKALENSTTEVIAPGGTAKTNTDVNVEYKLTWSWAFEEGADDPTKAANNEKDTALGKIAAGEAVDGYTAVTALKVGLTVTIEQTVA